MKKIFTFLLALFFSFSLLAESRLELRTAALFPSEKLFKKIYGNSFAEYQIQASNSFCDNFEIWANLTGFCKKGRSVGFHSKTNIKMATGSLGINFVYPFNCNLAFYLGAGPTLGRVWIKNHAHFEEDRHDSKQVWGGIIKSGAYIMYDNFFIDLFLDYSYQPIHFRHRVNIGGFQPGIGLGIQY